MKRSPSRSLVVRGAPREGASAGRGDEHERLGYRLYHAKIARRLFRWSGEGEV